MAGYGDARPATIRFGDDQAATIRPILPPFGLVPRQGLFGQPEQDQPQAIVILVGSTRPGTTPSLRELSDAIARTLDQSLMRGKVGADMLRGPEIDGTEQDVATTNSVTTDPDDEAMEKIYNTIVRAVSEYPVETLPRWTEASRRRRNFRRFSTDIEPGSLQLWTEGGRFDGRANVLVEWDRRLRSGLEAPGSAVLPVFFTGHVRDDIAEIESFEVGTT